MEKKSEKQEHKLGQEELENVCHQLSEQARQLSIQNNNLVKALEAANLTNLFKRLDYLFSIVEKDNKYFTEEFKIKCAEEIMEILSKEEPEEDTKSTK